jgi:hypothetical protein
MAKTSVTNTFKTANCVQWMDDEIIWTLKCIYIICMCKCDKLFVKW